MNGRPSSQVRSLIILSFRFPSPASNYAIFLSLSFLLFFLFFSSFSLLSIYMNLIETKGGILSKAGNSITRGNIEASIANSKYE